MTGMRIGATMSELKQSSSPWIAPPSTPLEGARIPAVLDQPLDIEDDDVVKTMRNLGHKGPITRELYIGFIHTRGEEKNWSPEDEADLPEALRDWSVFERKRHRR
jgi:hypothetical protein